MFCEHLNGREKRKTGGWQSSPWTRFLDRPESQVSGWTNRGVDRNSYRRSKGKRQGVRGRERYRRESKSVLGEGGEEREDEGGLYYCHLNQ